MELRYLRPISLLSLLLICSASAGQPFFRQKPREQSVLARVTVYWASGGRGSDRYTRQHKSATGLRLRTGHCAVDSRKIPYGSRVIFPDRVTLLAVDTGTAVRNRKAARLSGRTVYERNAVVVDRFFETKGQALAWAKRNPPFMTVRVIPPTSVQSMPLERVVASNTPMVIRKAIPVSKTVPISAPRTSVRKAADKIVSAKRNVES